MDDETQDYLGGLPCTPISNGRYAEGVGLYRYKEHSISSNDAKH